MRTQLGFLVRESFALAKSYEKWGKSETSKFPESSRLRDNSGFSGSSENSIFQDHRDVQAIFRTGKLMNNSGFRCDPRLSLDNRESIREF